MYDFSEWDKHDLIRYMEFLLHSYRVVDAFWFINVENTHGMDEACRLNERVWGKAGALAVRDLKKRFAITQKGLEGFARVLEIYPWHLIVGYEVERSPRAIDIRVPSCPPQVARLERGLGEYPCKEMHRAEFEGMAREIDQRIRVECLYAPPDEHPEEDFCRWRITME